MLAAGITLAFINVDLTVLANDARHTDTFISGSRSKVTVYSSNFKGLSIFYIPAGILEAKWLAKDNRQILDTAHAVQCRIGSLQTCAVVLTGITLALIDVLIAVLALVTRMALTEIVLHLINAPGSVCARIRDTFIDV